MKYPNGSEAMVSGPWGRITRMINVPRFAIPLDDPEYSYTTGKWNGDTLLGYTQAFYRGDGEFERLDIVPVNRHTFTPRQMIDGVGYSNTRYQLAYSELMGGWFLY